MKKSKKIRYASARERIRKHEAENGRGPTPKMILVLKRRRLWYEEMTFDEAKKLLDRIARAEGWDT